MAPAPPGRRQEALEVLADGNDESLDVRVPQAAQPESPQAMPILRFSEKRLDSDPAFPHRLLVGLRDVVAAHPLQVVGIEGAVHDPAMVAGCALGLAPR